MACHTNGLIDDEDDMFRFSEADLTFGDDNMESRMSFVASLRTAISASRQMPRHHIAEKSSTQEIGASSINASDITPACKDNTGSRASTSDIAGAQPKPATEKCVQPPRPEGHRLQPRRISDQRRLAVLAEQTASANRGDSRA
eukprot:TRINITY_DN3833_c0_g3_i1.p1 TRINITY_DN3833_c0_g3~~TRINITY_DN3833_c0_g3_i1.p1  ORF type:complete len:143 (-),score=20.88 TRINITY_DN3833_c0_g3_i1:61-489(-)